MKGLTSPYNSPIEIHLGLIIWVTTSCILVSLDSFLNSFVIASYKISKHAVLPEVVSPTNITPNLTLNVSNNYKILVSYSSTYYNFKSEIDYLI